MPTILLILGWRFFFYANEGNEPIHIHCKKGDKECKFWLDSAAFDAEEAYSYNMNSADKRDVKRSSSNISTLSSRNGTRSKWREENE